MVEARTQTLERPGLTAGLAWRRPQRSVLCCKPAACSINTPFCPRSLARKSLVSRVDHAASGRFWGGLDGHQVPLGHISSPPPLVVQCSMWCIARGKQCLVDATCIEGRKATAPEKAHV